MTKCRKDLEHYKRIEAAIRFIEQQVNKQPSLEEIAAHVHLSKHHFSRIFKEWVGISPVRFLHFLTVEHTKEKLAESRPLLETALSAGLSGSGRLHDLFINFEAMTPGEFKLHGKDVTIEYAFAPTPFGKSLLAQTTRGICYLGFVGESKDVLLAELFTVWKGATFIHAPSKILPLIEAIFYPSPNVSQNISILMKGTNFQINVWRALLTIPQGHLVTYKDIASAIGATNAARAVGSAVGKNHIGYIIPCHRAITSTGVLQKYRWGSSRKKALIGWEASRQELSNEEEQNSKCYESW